MADPNREPDYVTAWRQQVAQQGGRATIGAKGGPYAGKLVAAYKNPNGGPAVIEPAPSYVQIAYDKWISGDDDNWTADGALITAINPFSADFWLHPIATAQGAGAAADAAVDDMKATAANAGKAIARGAGDAAGAAAKGLWESLGPWGPVLVGVGLLLLASQFNQNAPRPRRG